MLSPLVHDPAEFGAVLRDTLAELRSAEAEEAAEAAALAADPVERLRLDAAHRLVATDGMPNPVGGIAAYRPAPELRSAPATLDLRFPAAPPSPEPEQTPKPGPSGRRRNPR